MKSFLVSCFVLTAVVLFVLPACPAGADDTVSTAEARIADAKTKLVAPQCVPQPKDPSLWDKSLAFGLNLTSGNSDTLLLNGEVAVSRNYERNNWLFRMIGNYGQDNDRYDPQTGQKDDKTKEDFKATGDYKRLLGERWYVGGGTEFFYDGIADIDYRVTLKNPWGYYLIKSSELDLGVEVGPGYIFEKVGGLTENYFAPRVGERIDWKISETAKLFQTAEYIMDVNDSENYIVNVEGGIEAAISTDLALVLSVTDSYDNLPAEGKKKNDLGVITALKIAL